MNIKNTLMEYKLLLICGILIVLALIALALSDTTTDFLQPDLQYSGTMIKSYAPLLREQGQDIVFEVDGKQTTSWSDYAKNLGYPSKLAERITFYVTQVGSTRIVTPVPRDEEAFTGNSEVSSSTARNSAISRPLMLCLGILLGMLLSKVRQQLLLKQNSKEEV